MSSSSSSIKTPEKNSNPNATIYLTTAIPYVNGAPHAGHALDYLLADVYKRYLEKQGTTVRLQAGTDEHGNKIWRKAKELNLPVEEYIAKNSTTFQDFIARLGVIPTDFIRTSDPAHTARCQKIWAKLKPHIYQATYTGWYCSGCESYVTETEYEENHGICPDHNTPYEHLSETNYYLRISDFKPRIKDAILSGEMQILPDFRKTEVLRLLDSSPDVSISRPRKNLSWGIPVPDNPDQIIYVWLDALTNYITVLGYPDTDISSLWPAAVQFVGKDILRFHAIIWPAILLGLDLPLPSTILSHGHINSNGKKMSKSIGNVIDPLDVLDKHGLDPFRYFFLRHIDTFADSDFTWERFEAAYTGELANDLGNLVSRLATLCAKNSVTLDRTALSTAASAINSDSEYNTLMSTLNFSKSLDYIWKNIQNLNKSLDEKKPWSLIKTDPETAKSDLASFSLSLVSIASLLSPFLPATSDTILTLFSAPEIKPAPILFPKS